MSQKSRTVRFGDKELKRIEEFLARNPVFDFSTLVRVALAEFIERPLLQLKPVPPSSPVKRERA